MAMRSLLRTAAFARPAIPAFRYGPARPRPHAISVRVLYPLPPKLLSLRPAPHSPRRTSHVSVSRPPPPPAPRSAPVAQTAKRPLATAPAVKPDHGHVERSFSDIWFGDPGAYPIIVIISGACVFCFCVGMRALFFYPDCRCVCARHTAALPPSLASSALVSVVTATRRFRARHAASPRGSARSSSVTGRKAARRPWHGGPLPRARFSVQDDPRG